MCKQLITANLTESVDLLVIKNTACTKCGVSPIRTVSGDWSRSGVWSNITRYPYRKYIQRHNGSGPDRAKAAKLVILLVPGDDRR